jgi:hypothetical protein
MVVLVLLYLQVLELRIPAGAMLGPGFGGAAGSSSGPAVDVALQLGVREEGQLMMILALLLQLLR